MKVVQIGILVALLVVAGLLFKVYQQQNSTPKPETPASAVAPPVNPASTAPGEALEPVKAEKSEAVTPAPAPVERRPSPSPVRRKSEPKAAREAPVQVAQAQTPATPPPAPVEQAPAAPPAVQPPAIEPPAAPSSPGALNPPSGTVAAPREPHKVTVPAGTLLTVRLTESLSSDRNQPGDGFTATLDQPLVIDGFVIAERGARLEGRVLEAEKAGRIKGVSSLAIQLTKLRTSDGQNVEILTERFLKEGPTSKGDDVKKIGAGAAIGAAIGAIAGGGKGAAIGAGVGGAAGTGTVMATRGKAATLPSETRISLKLQDPVTLTERIR